MSLVPDSLVAPAGLRPADNAVLPSREAADLPYPAGARTANWFSLFNALSWQITLGSPVVLYAKYLGASATILGVIASLMPLLVVLQLPAAKYLPKYGYRRFILAGWSSRTVMIFAIAAIPLLPITSAGVKLSLLVVCLFLFNLLRGMASGAWMPWMSELVPEPLRARYLSRDQVFSQIGSIGALTFAAVTLSGDATPWQFALVFLFSASAQTFSLWYVKRIPDVTAPETLKRSGHRVPWGAMLMYPPFFRLMIFNLLYFGATTCTSGLAVFMVAYLKGRANFSESSVLWLSGMAIVGALVSASRSGRVLDRRGSKSVLSACMLAHCLILVGWWAVACGLLGHTFAWIAALSLATGAAQVIWTIANNRLMMSTMPLMGRNHFFAMFIVITYVGLGIAPIAWGLLLDGIGHFEFGHGLIEWNRYSIYFAAALMLAIAGLLYSRLLFETQPEHKAEDAMRDGSIVQPTPLPETASVGRALLPDASQVGCASAHVGTAHVR